MKTIGIFPASGGLATATLTHLVNLLPTYHNNLVLISRYPSKIPSSYIDSGIRVCQASYESSAEELQAAFACVDVLFLISYPSHVHEYRVKVQLPAIDAAHRAGVSHIFYSSLAFGGGDLTATTSRAVVMQAHLDTEHHLRALAASDTGFTYTIVREGLYAESFPIYTAFWSMQTPVREVLIPHDGERPGVAWVKREELGEGTARLIRDYVEDPMGFKWINGVVLFTGPRVWTLAETVRALGEVVGKDVVIKRIGVDEYVRLPQVLAKFGTEEKARIWATAWEAIRAAETAVVSDDLEEVLGRRPEEFDAVVSKMVTWK